MSENDRLETEEFRQACLTKHKASFDLNKRLLKLAQCMMDSKKIKGESQFHDVMAFLFSKSYKTFWAIHILAQHGFGQDAVILTRSLFEILVTSKYIIAKDADLVEKFVKYDLIVHKKRADKLKEDIERERIPRIQELEAFFNDTVRMQELAESYSQVKDLYPDKRYWSDKSIKKMAEDVGLSFDYDYFYQPSSDMVHTNAMIIEDYTDFEGESMICDVVPSETSLQLVFHSSIKYFICILHIVDKTYKLECEDQLAEIGEAFNQTATEP